MTYLGESGESTGLLRTSAPSLAMGPVRAGGGPGKVL
jgi:hypothetical protein